MRQSKTENWWNPKRVEAAQLVAEDQLSDEKIAQQLSIARATLARWKTEEVFKDRVTEIINARAEALKKKGIRLRENRLAKLNSVVEKIEQVFAERAARATLSPEVDDEQCPQIVGELKTGVVLIQHKRFGTEYAIDAPALREYREYLKQAAIEVGEWTEKQEITGADNGPLTVQILDSISKAYGDPQEEAQPD